MGKWISLFLLLSISQCFPQAYDLNAGSKVRFGPGVTNWIVNGVSYPDLISAINAMSGSITNTTLPGNAVLTNFTISTSGPIIGGSALSSNFTLGFNGAVTFNAIGATNLNASSIVSGTLSKSLLPTQSGTQMVASAASIVTINFPSTFTNSPSVVFSIMRTAPDPLVTGNLIAVASNAFQISFSANTPTANYSIHWHAFP